MTKTFMTAALASVSLAAAVLAGAPAQAQTRLDTALAAQGDAQLILAACYRGERSSDCRQRYRAEQSSHRHYVWRNGRYEDDSGAAILGFALGAAIAGSRDDHDYYNSHRNDRDWQERCRTNYGNFDPRTGTYGGDDGYRHYCTR